MIYNACIGCVLKTYLFMENPEKTWNDFLAKEMQKAPQNQVFD